MQIPFECVQGRIVTDKESRGRSTNSFVVSAEDNCLRIDNKVDAAFWMNVDISGIPFPPDHPVYDPSYQWVVVCGRIGTQQDKPSNKIYACFDSELMEISCNSLACLEFYLVLQLKQTKQ